MVFKMRQLGQVIGIMIMLFVITAMLYIPIKLGVEFSEFILGL